MGQNIVSYFENLMANPGVLIMLTILLIMTIVFAMFYIKDVMGSNDLGEGTWFKAGIIGFITDFFDTLGIGSFAPTTALLKFTNSARDENIPGVLNISHTIPVVLEAFLFITVIQVEAKTLVLMIGAAVLGAYVGSGYVAKMDKKKIQLVMGVALAITACIMLIQQTGLAGSGTGTATGLEGWKLAVGVIGNFFLGALMTAGVGLYAPCMALVAMLGLSPAIAFPIMMGSCAFLMPVAGINYVKEGKYERKTSLGITIGGVCGVIFAFILMQQIPFDQLLQVLTWVVIAVIIYTSITMLKAFNASKA